MRVVSWASDKVIESLLDATKNQLSNKNKNKLLWKWHRKLLRNNPNVNLTFKQWKSIPLLNSWVLTKKEVKLTTIIDESVRNSANNKENNNKHACPELKLRIENINVKALIDSGSEISCISESFFKDNLRVLEIKPILPVSGYSIKVATGQKTVKITKQILLTVQWGSHYTQIIFIVVPKLIRDCIIGYDTMKNLKFKLDTDERTIDLEVEGLRETLKYDENILNNNEHNKLHISYINDSGSDESAFYIDSSRYEVGVSVEGHDDLTVEDIQYKIGESNHLAIKDREKLTDLIYEFKEVFKNKIGLIKVYTHKFNLKDEEPYFTKQYPIPINYRDKVRKKLKEMLESNIIRRSTSNYINPIVISIKKDGSVRFCLDARKLNKKLLRDYETPINIEEIFQQCHGIKFMSSFDLTNSFWQIPLAEESKKYTAFMIDGNVYEFNVVPFGTSTSTAALVRGLNLSIGDLKQFVIPFVDDILCVSKNFEEHLNHLRILFECCKRDNYTLKFSKSRFVHKEIPFLGYVLTNQGIKAQTEKLEIILNHPPPKNMKSLQSFLGFVNFYTKFIKNYSECSKPLLNLLKKGTEYKWTEEHQVAFDAIKKLFVSTLILKFPKPNKPYILTTDASYHTIAAILSQRNDDGDEEIITCISRTLRGSELNYFTTEKELLAIVWSCSKLDAYLKGASRVTVRTDHEALKFLNKCNFHNARLIRWCLALQDYNIDYEYIPGNQNNAADFLTRCTKILDDSKSKEIVLASLLTKPTKTTLRYFKNIQKLQEQDSFCKQITQKDNFRQRYVYKDKLLYKNCKRSGLKLVLPENRTPDFIKELHEIYGHIGSRKLFKMLDEDFYIPKVKEKINKVTKYCDLCQRTKYVNQKVETMLQPILIHEPRDLLSIDFYGPLPTSRGGTKYILTTIDVFSKFVVMYPIKRATTSITIKKIFEDYIPKYGKMKAICSDHGSQFTSKSWSTKLHSENIRPIFSSIRHPQSNVVERMHRSLGCFLRSLVDKKHQKWATIISKIQEIFNSTYQETIEMTPSEAHLNLKPLRFWTKFIPSQPKAEPSYAQKILSIRQKMHSKLKRRALRYNSQINHKPLPIGSLVLIRSEASSKKDSYKIKKFFHLFEGPYKVDKRKGSDTYLLKHSNGNPRGIFHRSNLKPYYKQKEKES